MTTNNDANLFEDINFDDMDLEGTPAPTVKVTTTVTEVIDTAELKKQAAEEAGLREELLTAGNDATKVVDTLMNADPLDVDNFFGELGIKEEEKKAAKGGKKTKEKKEGEEDETPKEEAFTGPRPVIVYGQELFIEEDPKVTLETIRARIVNEFKFPEFSKERTHMSFDKTTGIIVPVIEFKKKG